MPGLASRRLLTPSLAAKEQMVQSRIANPGAPEAEACAVFPNKLSG
jgi:hypothetical protein